MNSTLRTEALPTGEWRAANARAFRSVIDPRMCWDSDDYLKEAYTSVSVLCGGPRDGKVRTTVAVSQSTFLFSFFLFIFN